MSEGFFKKFLNAVGTNPQAIAMPEMPKPELMFSLEEMLERLVKVPNSVWGMYAFSRDILRDKISTEEKNRLTIKANECGCSYADQLAEKYGTTVPSQIAEALGLQISYPELPSDLSRVTFAEFEEPNKILIYKDNLDKARILIEEGHANEILGVLHIEELLIAHEIFHYMEMKDSKNIFTLNEKVDLWAPKPFRNRSTIRCLGEIAGMAFAQRLLGLNYSPFVMDVFFVYGYNKEVAVELYNEISTLVIEA